MKKVAIIVRTKDRPLLLKRALNSIFMQTLSDYVVVVVNDGGSATEVNRVLSAFENKFKSEMRVLHNPTPSGRWQAANQGLNESDSKYVVLLDDDDSWAPNFLEKSTQILDSNQSSMGVVVKSERITETIHEDTISVVSKEPYLDFENIGLYDCLSTNPIPTNGFMYRRKVFKTIGMYDQTMNVLADWDFNIRFLQHFDIEIIPEKLAYIHHRESSGNSYKNSVIAGVRDHQEQRNKLLNKYLREDLSKRMLGVGYIINDLDFARRKSEQQYHGVIHAIDLYAQDVQRQMHQSLERLDQIEHDLRRLEKLTRTPIDRKIFDYLKRLPKRIYKRINT